MDDLISRQAAIDVIRQVTIHAEDESLAVEALENLPSAQPEIIRCKDCKWKYKHNCTRAVEIFIDDDNYCSWAERIE